MKTQRAMKRVSVNTVHLSCGKCRSSFACRRWVARTSVEDQWSLGVFTVSPRRTVSPADEQLVRGNANRPRTRTRPAVNISGSAPALRGGPCPCHPRGNDEGARGNDDWLAGGTRGAFSCSVICRFVFRLPGRFGYDSVGAVTKHEFPIRREPWSQTGFLSERREQWIAL